MRLPWCLGLGPVGVGRPCGVQKPAPGLLQTVWWLVLIPAGLTQNPDGVSIGKVGDSLGMKAWLGQECGHLGLVSVSLYPGCHGDGHNRIRPEAGGIRLSVLQDLQIPSGC